MRVDELLQATLRMDSWPFAFIQTNEINERNEHWWSRQHWCLAFKLAERLAQLLFQMVAVVLLFQCQWWQQSPLSPLLVVGIPKLTSREPGRSGFRRKCTQECDPLGFFGSPIVLFTVEF